MVLGTGCLMLCFGLDLWIAFSFTVGWLHFRSFELISITFVGPH